MSDSRVQQFVPFKKSGTIVLLKTSTDTLKLLNPNANALMLGDATHEGGDIKVYRDGSGNLQLSVDADAVSNEEAMKVYGGVVCQNYLTVGRPTLDTTYPLYVSGASRLHGYVYCSSGGFRLASANEGVRALSNAPLLTLSIDVTGTDSTNHDVKSQVDGTDIIVARATGDGAGGITNPAIGLYPGTTPIVQAAHIADPAESTAGNNAAIDAILVALENIGILASS